MTAIPLDPRHNLAKCQEVMFLVGLLTCSLLTFINVRGRRACEVEDLW